RGSENALETTLANLVATNGGTAGNIIISEFDAFVVRQALHSFPTRRSSDLDISAAGAVTVEAAGTGGSGVTINGAAASTGTITLEARGKGQNLGISDAVSSNAGKITLQGGDNVTFTAAGTVTSTSGNVAVTA